MHKKTYARLRRRIEKLESVHEAVDEEIRPFGTGFGRDRGRWSHIRPSRSGWIASPI
jgi:hypothetical protein